MKIRLLSVILLISIASCDKSAPSYNVNPTTPVVSYIDSLLFDKPELGDINTELKFPFGLTDRPANAFRLEAVKRLGKPYMEYKYDNEGKLIEKKSYFTDGLHILSSVRYTYSVSGISKIEYWVNIQAKDIESDPTTNELKLYASDVFTNNAQGAILDKIYQRNEDGGSYYSPEPRQVGFDKRGQKVWEATTNDGKIVMDYWVYNRDESGNVLLYKWRRNFDYEIGNQTKYTYDQKYNPYTTTGDPADWRSSNPNNILKEEFSNNIGSKTSTQFKYVYRADGYPSQLIDVESKEVSLEFIYNK